MKIEIHHVQVCVPRNSEDEARAFYCGVMGLKEIEKPAESKEHGGLWAQLGDLQLHIGLEDGMDRSKTRAHIAYQVEDLAEWKNRFEAANLTILKKRSLSNYIRFDMRDPFGNCLEFMQLV